MGGPATGFTWTAKTASRKLLTTPTEGHARRAAARRLLASQPDFQAQRSLLKEVARELGCEIIFLPKFHCEINYIGECAHGCSL